MSPSVLLFGTFDHFHLGHAFVIHEALRRGDVTVVIARDSNVEKAKGRLPDQGEEERSKALVRLFPSVRVTFGDESDFLAPIRAIRPALILLGYDQRLPGTITIEALRNMGISIERLGAFEPEKHKSSLHRSSKYRDGKK